MIDYLDKAYKETGKSGQYCTDARNQLKQEMPWFEDIPAHTLYGAMMDAAKDYRMVVRRRAQGKVTNLPRCRKHTQKSFYVLGNAITKNGIYPRRLGKLKTAEPLPDKPSDSRIMFEADKFWLRVPYQHAVTQTENQGRVCAIDPGIRTFGTVYSPEGIGKIAPQAFNRIQRLASHLDDLISRTSKETNGQRKSRMKLAQARIRLRIRNLVDDLHYQAIGWLVGKFDTIIFPEANFTTAVAKRSGRKIGSRSARMLLTYSFAKFRDRLKFKAELLGKTVVTVCESFTSKTHNITGEIIKDLGGRKTIESKGIRIDRDLNGALGIFLKALSVQPLQKCSAL